jgi:DNA polymerase elongation subunit (family B)
MVLDVECYPNYFLVLFSDGFAFEMLDDQPGNTRDELADRMQRQLTIGFNSRNYDLPMIYKCLCGYRNAELYRDSAGIVQHGERGSYPQSWNHIDIKEVAPGVQISLKLYGGRLHSARLQDLPFDPNQSVTRQQADEIRRYCQNDIDTTVDLVRAIKPQLKLRGEMSNQYRLDLRSKSDAQIAEAVLISELEKTTGQVIKRPEIDTASTFRYKAPRFRFVSDELRQVLEDVQAARFHLGKNLAIEMPDQLSGRDIAIGASVYRMGIGGLHSSEKCTSHYSGERLLIDLDVASYYPSIILNAGMYPPQCGVEFLDVYRSIVARRLEAKRAGDKVVADSLKITINGSFGKLGSGYSNLFAPNLFIQVTITGQLALLMLIEQLELAGIPVVSGNTDGIVTMPTSDELPLLREIARNWQDVTGFELEETAYRSLHCRDVNNYIAVKPDGSVKRKGVFAPPGLMKNPAMPILADAVADHLSHGVPIADAVDGCQDIRKFLTVRRVTGGGEWRGEYMGKVVRWYWSTDGEAMRYVKNGNQVATSAGCKPCMTLPDTIPDDLDMARYIEEANKLLMQVNP